MGTMIQRYKLEEEDYRGERFQRLAFGCKRQQRPAVPYAAASSSKHS
jgi:methionine synthase I (cobalamin-dependent)